MKHIASPGMRLGCAAARTSPVLPGFRSFAVIRGSVPFEEKQRLRFEVTELPGASSDWGLIWSHGLQSSFRSESEGGWPFAGVAGLADILPVLRYDARGHGLSDAAGSCTWHEMGGDLLQLRRVMGDRKVVLGGTSMGAAASLFAALEDQSVVHGLIVATPPTCYELRQKFVPLYAESAKEARRTGLEAAKLAADGRAKPPIFLETDAGRASFDIGWRTKFEMGVDRYCTAIEGALASDLPPKEKLATLDVPTLILAWQSDVQHPVPVARMLSETLPNAELHVAKSWSEIEQFPDRMRQFLSSITE